MSSIMILQAKEVGLLDLGQLWTRVIILYIVVISLFIQGAFAPE